MPAIDDDLTKKENKAKVQFKDTDDFEDEFGDEFEDEEEDLDTNELLDLNKMHSNNNRVA